MTSEEYLHLEAAGIIINECHVDYKMLSIRCCDLSVYRKAFRVKIRALIKEDNILMLKKYIKAYYLLAQFVHFIYGFHSCSEDVNAWQEELALYLQTKFIEDDMAEYDCNRWLEYDTVQSYCETFTKQYKIYMNSVNDTLACVQDGKPFLSLKDKAHFEKAFA